MILDKLKAYGWMAAAIVAGGLLLVQTGRLYSEQKAHGDLKTAVAQAGEKRAEEGRIEDNKAADKDAAHAASTQGNSDAFTQKQPARDASYRADLARVERLRRDAEGRAATYRAQAQANAAACSNLAHRLETLDRQLVEGVEVVGGLRADLERRDDEVVLLHSQVLTERAVNTE